MMPRSGPVKWRVTLLLVLTGALPAADAPPLPVVELEEIVYSFEPADNGAGPMWCRGSTCLARVGEDVFASGLETIPEAKPLNNCRWMLFHRGPQGWKRVRTDTAGRTREPAPLIILPGGRVFLSANPTLVKDPQAYAGPARPELLEFTVADLAAAPQTHIPVWDGLPKFTEHSYRSFAADGRAGELILFQNIDYTHAEWTFRDREGRWSAQGRLKWPWGADYAKPEPIRVCYPNVALQNRAVHFCGVSDIIEPNPAWREFKKQLTGREWDYDFRRLFYTWTPDLTKTPFAPWVEVASREQTCGWIMPEDLWVAPDGAVFVIWTERAIDERLRAKFFPDAMQSHALNLALLRDGKVLRRHTLIEAREGGPHEIPGSARFQVTPDNRLWVISYVSGTDKSGSAVSENRLMAIDAQGKAGPPVRVPLQKPFTSFFTATVRAGSGPSAWLDLLGHQAGESQTISYARIRLP